MFVSKIALMIVVLCVPGLQCLTDPKLPNIFYPFGTDEGDSVAPVNDDGYAYPLTIDVGFPFFNSTRTRIFVCTNGALSFDVGVSTFTPDPFPIPYYTIIAAYWADVDTRMNDGRIYYRQSTDSELLQRGSRDIQRAYFTSSVLGAFQARWIFIATWHNVTHFGGSNKTSVNTFQAVLLTDGTYSFTVFNYGTLTWTTGTASGGNSSGLGGTPAQVGFNAGDSVNFYAVPSSRTADILKIYTTSNVNEIGRWIFRIDGATIEAPNCQQLGNCAVPTEATSAAPSPSNDESAGCASTGSLCITWSPTTCQGLEDGDYQACGGCTFYHSCSNGLIYANRSCPLTSLGGLRGRLVWTALSRNSGVCSYNSGTCTECVSSRAQPSAPCRTGPTCITSSPTACTDQPDGDYQACEGCTYYHSCSNQVNYAFRPCPVGLVWVADSLSQGHCDYSSDTCTAC